MNNANKPEDNTLSVAARPRLLFVDDEPQILNALRWLFRREYDVHLAEGGEQALQAMRRQQFHVIVCDQRMPGMSGIEVLREAARVMPGAMRLLLTGYADLKAVVGSVNDGEVFRFVTKPWANDELKAVVGLAARAAFEAPAPIASGETITRPPDTPELLLLSRDEETRLALTRALPAHYTVGTAATTAAALDLLEKQPIHVLIADTGSGDPGGAELVKRLKQERPEIISLVLTGEADAKGIVELINQGQVYRVLQKPVKPAQCRLAIQSALIKHAQLRTRPALAWRHVVESPADTGPRPAWVEQIGRRVRRLRNWFTNP